MGVTVRVTADEADAMAASCDEPKCWAGPGGFCKTPSGTKRRPHPGRVGNARRLGLLDGKGRQVLTAARLAEVDELTIRVAGAVLILPGVSRAG